MLHFLKDWWIHSYPSILYYGFKGEVRSWSNLISEERVKFSEQNSENLMKIGWKIRKLWHFEISNFFGKHFLTSPYEYSNERVDDVIPSQFSIHFIYRNEKNLIFQLCEYKTCVITTQSKWEIMFYSDTFWCGDMFLPVWAKNEKISKFYIQYIWKIVRGWHHQLAHLNIHKDWSRNVFRNNVKFQNVISSLFLIQFS